MTAERGPWFFVDKLPKPYHGVLNEVLFDHYSNRQQFVDNSLQNMMDENEELANIVVERSVISPDPERSLDLALIYYEIYSRSARKGMPMLRISSDEIEAKARRDIETIGRLIGARDEDGTRRYFLSEYASREDLIFQEARASSELTKFWTMAKMYEAYLLHNNKDPDFFLMALYDLQVLLHTSASSQRSTGQPKTN